MHRSERALLHTYPLVGNNALKMCDIHLRIMCSPMLSSDHVNHFLNGSHELVQLFMYHGGLGMLHALRVHARISSTIFAAKSGNSSASLKKLRMFKLVHKCLSGDAGLACSIQKLTTL